jgi:hypothetical protein
MSLSAARMLITPWPLLSVCMKSLMFSIGSPKNLLATLGFDLQQPALDRADAGGAHVAILGGEVGGVVAHVLQHGAQVLQVEQQQAVVVGDLEDQIQHAGLGLVQVQHAAQQQRAHVGDRCPHRVALLAKHIPQSDGAGDGFGRIQRAILEDGGHLFADGAGLADAGQVALDVGHEHRHADFREILGQGLQGDGFARAGGPGDQAMAVGQGGQQVAFSGGVLGDQHRFGHGGRVPEGGKVKSEPTD